MVNDLINRQAVLDVIVASINQFGGRYTTDQMNMWGLFAQLIQELPTAEITLEQIEEYCRPRCLTIVAAEFFHTMLPTVEKKGKWINGNCSVCGSKRPIEHIEFKGYCIWETNTTVNYCPNCGARMKEENNEGNNI